MPDFPLKCHVCRGYGNVTNEKKPRPWNDYLVELVQNQEAGSSLIQQEKCPRCLGSGAAILVTVIDDSTLEVDPIEFELSFEIIHGVLVGPSMAMRVSDMAEVSVAVLKMKVEPDATKN